MGRRGYGPVSRMASREEVVTILQHADAICFDVDSTVCMEEGIDELAEFCGKGHQIKEMTRQAMAGNTDFRSALEMRLGIIRPSRTSIEEMLRTKPLRLTPGIKELIDKLRQRGKAPFLVSGGFDVLIKPLAEELGIPADHVFANRILFDAHGDYLDFDRDQFTSRSGGKGAVIEYLKKTRHFQVVVMIGDGATDLEACPPADAFIGFGGNVIRAAVQEKAAWFVCDFEEIARIL